MWGYNDLNIIIEVDVNHITILFIFNKTLQLHMGTVFSIKNQNYSISTI